VCGTGQGASCIECRVDGGGDVGDGKDDVGDDAVPVGYKYGTLES
jgi:hypothetical protein